jgi:phosphate transport system protein
MPRTAFEQQLHELEDDLLALGSMVEKAVLRSIDALKRRDHVEAQQVVGDDKLVNEKRFQIEEKCLQLLATQQPMAVDLRTIVSVLHISVDLERMGDHAEGIARVSLRIGDEPFIKPLVDIPRMADLALDMLRRSLDAFTRRDVELAKQVARDDDEVDVLHEQVYRDLLTYMIENRENINQSTYLTWVAHNLERIADRSTNIAERVVFAATGRMEEIGASMYLVAERLDRL